MRNSLLFFKKILKIYYKLVSYNIEEKTQEDTFAIITNQIAVVTIFISTLYTTIFYLLGNYQLFYKYTPLIFSFFIIIFLNSKGYYKVAKYLYILSVHIMLLLASIYNGAESSADWYYYVIPFLSIIMFPPKEKADMIIGIILIIPFYLTTRYLYTVVEPYSMPDIVVSALHYSVYFSLLSTLLVFIFIFRLTFFRLRDEILTAKEEVEAIHKHTRDSIEYASLIQGALISTDAEMKPFFKDHFVFWEPKDTVGGDIWLFEQLRYKDECLLFFIDCTGHGVAGAFVTMIVKSVEREVISNLKKHPELDISPAIIMGYFNKTMKKLLGQESKDSLSNVGWDGGIIYYNRRTQILKFAGAETPLFYTTADGEFKTIKGNRYSVGYKKCDSNYTYKETVLEVQEGMKFYCTTDGYLDQNGGEKDFPFGKKRFGNIIKEHYIKSMSEQKTIFIDEMHKYESIIQNNDRNDDITVIAFEIAPKSDYYEDKIVEIFKYEGVMTQNVIATCIDNIESKISDIGMIGTASTITIEYCQNMMNYSKNEEKGSRQIVPAGTIEVQHINDAYYDIIATNIVSIEDKQKIEPKLLEIQGLDKAGIKKRYRELRKSGQNTHEKGGGIGIYEIAKVSDKIAYNFEAINDDKYSFTMKSILKPKKREN